VIIEDRIRECEAGRSSSGFFCPAATAVAQFPAFSLVAFQAISNRNLTMRRASASRASEPRRTTRGVCSSFSNRELKLLGPPLSHRKQTKAPGSNRELSTNLCGNNSQLPPLPLPQICKWSRPLLTGSAPQTEFDVTYRKQTTEKFLTGARTHIRETRFCAKMNGQTNEEKSAEISKMKAIR
jgi:hypothetical protein